jgi:hypothetical protein
LVRARSRALGASIYTAISLTDQEFGAVRFERVLGAIVGVIMSGWLSDTTVGRTGRLRLARNLAISLISVLPKLGELL